MSEELTCREMFKYSNLEKMIGSWLTWVRFDCGGFNGRIVFDDFSDR